MLTATVPERKAHRLFIIREVLACDKNQRRQDTGLEGPAQDAQGNKTSVILESGMTGIAKSPTNKTPAEKLCDGESVEQPYVRQREHEGSYPEVGISMRVLIAPEVDLGGHSHDISILVMLADALMIYCPRPFSKCLTLSRTLSRKFNV